MLHIKGLILTVECAYKSPLHNCTTSPNTRIKSFSRTTVVVKRMGSQTCNRPNYAIIPIVQFTQNGQRKSLPYENGCFFKDLMPFIFKNFYKTSQKTRNYCVLGIYISLINTHNELLCCL